MKAYLVYWSPATRVLVPDDASEQQIEEIAKNQFLEILKSDFPEHIESIIEDEECPYDPKFDNQ